MTYHGKLTPPESNSNSYEIFFKGIEDGVNVPGLNLHGFFLAELGTEKARNELKAVISALSRYGMREEYKRAVISEMEKTGMENFVKDLGPNPPQKKNMIRYMAMVKAKYCDYCDRKAFDRYRKEITEDFEGRDDELVREYYRAIEIEEKSAGSCKNEPGRGNL